MTPDELIDAPDITDAPCFLMSGPGLRPCLVFAKHRSHAEQAHQAIGGKEKTKATPVSPDIAKKYRELLKAAAESEGAMQESEG